MVLRVVPAVLPRLSATAAVACSVACPSRGRVAVREEDDDPSEDDEGDGTAGKEEELHVLGRRGCVAGPAARRGRRVGAGVARARRACPAARRARCSLQLNRISRALVRARKLDLPKGPPPQSLSSCQSRPSRCRPSKTPSPPVRQPSLRPSRPSQPGPPKKASRRPSLNHLPHLRMPGPARGKVKSGAGTARGEGARTSLGPSPEPVTVTCF